MKKRLLVVLLAALSAAVLGLIGYITLNSETTVRDPVSIYRSAIADISYKEDMILSITEKKEISVGNETFISESQKTVKYDANSSDTLRIHSQEILLSGAQDVMITELLTDGLLITEINNVHFKSDETEASYLSRSLPPVIIDDQLYKNITGIRTDGNYIISFSNPQGLERWVTENMPQDYSAEGAAYIDQKGVLTKSCYTVVYTIDSIRYHTVVNIDISRENVAITTPKDTDTYTHIDNPEALRALEMACGYLLQAKNISFFYSDNIYVQAMGDRRTQTIKGTSATTDDDLSAKIETNISLRNDSRTDQSTEFSKFEAYTDGQYFISTNSGEPVPNAEITATEMLIYIQNQLVSTIMLPRFIDSTQISETTETITYIFGGNPDFSKYLAESAFQILYGNSQLLEGASDNITAKEFRCYLTVNKHTQIPTASGIIYTGKYKTSDIPYQLQYHAEQTYNIPNIP